MIGNNSEYFIKECGLTFNIDLIMSSGADSQMFPTNTVDSLLSAVEGAIICDGSGRGRIPGGGPTKRIRQINKMSSTFRIRTAVFGASYSNKLLNNKRNKLPLEIELRLVLKTIYYCFRNVLS